MPQPSEAQPKDRVKKFLERPPGDAGGHVHTKRALWISMIVGIFVSGIAFAYKIAEFLDTVGS